MKIVIKANPRYAKRLYTHLRKRASLNKKKDAIKKMKLIVTFPEEKKDEVVKSLESIMNQVEGWNKALPTKAAMKVLQFITGSSITTQKFAISEYYLIDKNKLIWKLTMVAEGIINPVEIANRLNNSFKKRLGEEASVKLWQEKNLPEIKLNN